MFIIADKPFKLTIELNPYDVLYTIKLSDLKVQQTMQKPVIIAVVLSSSALLLALILNILFRHQYYKMGINFIQTYQTQYQSSFATTVQNIISQLGNTGVIFCIVIVCFYRKITTLTYLAFIAINLYMIGVQKQAFQDPRPFFFTTKIQALGWSCAKSYGFPSGHSWMCVLMYEPVVSDMIGTKGIRKLLLILVLLSGILVPLSRQYLGFHTADQVTYGILNTLSWLTLYKYCLRDNICKLFKYCLQGTRRGLILFLTTFFFLLSFIAPLVLYKINTSTRIFSQYNIDLINSSCNSKTTYESLEHQAGIQSAIIGLAFGIVYGFLINGTKVLRRFYQIQINEQIWNRFYFFMRGQWNFNGKVVNVVKYLAIYACILVAFLLGILSQLQNLIDNYIGEHFYRAFAYCAFGITLSVLAPVLLFKFGAVYPQFPENDEDIIKMVSKDSMEQGIASSSSTSKPV